MSRIKCDVCGTWAMKNKSSVNYCCASCLCILNNRAGLKRRKLKRLAEKNIPMKPIHLNSNYYCNK